MLVWQVQGSNLRRMSRRFNRASPGLATHSFRPAVQSNGESLASKIVPRMFRIMKNGGLYR